MRAFVVVSFIFNPFLSVLILLSSKHFFSESYCFDLAYVWNKLYENKLLW